MSKKTICKVWQNKFEEEFGCHFKNSKGELGFAIAFIEELLNSEKQDIGKKLWAWFYGREGLAIEDLIPKLTGVDNYHVKEHINKKELKLK